MELSGAATATVNLPAANAEEEKQNAKIAAEDVTIQIGFLYKYLYLLIIVYSRLVDKNSTQ
jgi:hypothetical protein